MQIDPCNAGCDVILAPNRTAKLRDLLPEYWVRDHVAATPGPRKARRRRS